MKFKHFFLFFYIIIFISFTSCKRTRYSVFRTPTIKGESIKFLVVSDRDGVYKPDSIMDVLANLIKKEKVRIKEDKLIVKRVTVGNLAVPVQLYNEEMIYKIKLDSVLMKIDLVLISKKIQIKK